MKICNHEKIDIFILARLNSTRLPKKQLKKSIENNKRSTLTWYAIDYDFIPVKIEQYRKKSLKFSVILNKVYK